MNEVLAHAGLSYARTTRDAQPRRSLGIRASVEGGKLLVDAVVRGSAAEAAGIDPHDEIVAIGDRRVTEGRIDAALQGLRPGDEDDGDVHPRRPGAHRGGAARRGARARRQILARADATPEQRALYAAWLGASFARPAHQGASR